MTPSPTEATAMPTTMKDLGIDRLSVDDRVVLAHEIWDSVAADVERAPLTEPQRRELERRLADHQANPDDVVPWEQIKAEALARFSR
jgi:putative addiction module component (TIGR02574 family)